MRFYLTFLMLLTVVGRSLGQVTVELYIEQEQYLRDEAIPVKVRVINRSGQKLVLGQDNEWLSFNIDAPNGAPVTRVAPVPVKGEFDLESAQMATREADLQPWFELGQPGRYSVTATVRLKQWDQEIVTKPRSFEVVRGSRLWDQEVGIPTASGSPDLRRYILQQASYRKQLKLYARIASADDSYAYRVLQLGSIVSFGQPGAQVDRDSNLHVLFQTGARSFSYTVVDPSGAVLSRAGYDYAGSRPTLRVTEEGKIYVAGGSRRLIAADVAPPRPTTNTPPSKDAVPPSK